MANAFILPEEVIFAALGLLQREITLPQLVWTDGFGDWTGRRNDTVTLRVPAYAVSRSRTLRSGTSITVDNMDETSVDVNLSTEIYKAVAISDADLSLSIVDFGEQILSPNVSAIARGIEDLLETTMMGATYQAPITVSEPDPYLALVAARAALNKFRVPAQDRFCAIGANVEAALLSSDRFKVLNAGAVGETALQDATIGRLAGFQIVSSPGLDADHAVVGHRSAFALPMRAPAVPTGAVWGISEAYQGLSMRALRDYDYQNTSDRLLLNSFVGCQAIKDSGTVDSNGIFTPDPTGAATPIFVRACLLTMSPTS